MWLHFWEELAYVHFKEELLYTPWNDVNENLDDNWHLYLEYQRLECIWDRLEDLWYDEEVQKVLEEIWNKQFDILNQIKIN